MSPKTKRDKLAAKGRNTKDKHPQTKSTKPQGKTVVKAKSSVSPHHAQYIPDKVFPFLKLPAELRIKIYGYAFQERMLKILPLTKRSGLTSWDPRSRKPKPSLQNSKSASEDGRSLRRGRSDRRLAKWPKVKALPGLAALLLTCKQIHQETQHLLYGQVTFVFTSQGVLSRFLTTLSLPCLATIQSLKLQHHTYGEPYLTENKIWKRAYDSKWDDLCQEAAEKMTGLQELDVKLSIYDWPTKLDLEARWAASLLRFAGRRLKKAKVVLEMKWRCVEEERLTACAEALEETLVMPEYRASLEDAKARTAQLPKAIRCLRITRLS